MSSGETKLDLDPISSAQQCEGHLSVRNNHGIKRCMNARRVFWIRPEAHLFSQRQDLSTRALSPLLQFSGNWYSEVFLPLIVEAERSLCGYRSLTSFFSMLSPS